MDYRIHSKRSKYLSDLNVSDAESLYFCICAATIAAMNLQRNINENNSNYYKKQLEKLAITKEDFEIHCSKEDKNPFVVEKILKDNCEDLTLDALKWLFVNASLYDFDVNILSDSDGNGTHVIYKHIANPFLKKRRHTFNLLQRAVENTDADFRYQLITDISMLLQEPRISENGKTHIPKKKHCNRCFLSFRSIEKYNQHMMNCDGIEEQVMKMPEYIKYFNPNNPYKPILKPPTRKFEHYNAMQLSPITIYWDLETSQQSICDTCIQTKASRSRCKCTITEDLDGFLNVNVNKSKTTVINQHQAISYSYAIVSMDGKLIYEKTRICKDGRAAYHMLKDWIKIEPILMKILANNTPLEMTSADWKKYYKSKKCGICDVPYTKEYVHMKQEITANNLTIVRHHCHFTG